MPVDPNAFPIRANAFSLDACRPKCISGVLISDLARHQPIQMRFRSLEMSSRSTSVDPNAFPIRANELSPNACRHKCFSIVLKDALARRVSVQMPFPYAQMCSHTTPVYPNASPMCSDALSLDACRSKCIAEVFRCDLARRFSIQMRYAETSSRLTLVLPHEFPTCSGCFEQLPFATILIVAK